MNKDRELIFEAYKEVASTPTFYTHEKIATMIPKDLEDENDVLNHGAEVLAKLVYNGDIKKASKFMYYDEDFNQDLISSYFFYKKHGFPEIPKEDEMMPANIFYKLGKHASPKSSKEKEETDKDLHDLAKKDSREEYKEQSIYKLLNKIDEVSNELNKLGNENISNEELNDLVMVSNRLTSVVNKIIN